jgi:uncharacterized protein (DUF58 family)
MCSPPSSRAFPRRALEMRLRPIPSSRTILALVAGAGLVLVLLLLGMPGARAGWLAAAFAVALCAACVADFALTRRAWQEAAPILTRRLPTAFAIGVSRSVALSLSIQSAGRWRLRLYDHADATLQTEGLPRDLIVDGPATVELDYTATPSRRGRIVFAPADVRVMSRCGLLELTTRLGMSEERRVYPDFAQVSRYAWLAGDRRLAEIGIKTYQQRGQGTDFKQLAEYRTGDAVRHIDWKATLRFDKPIVRQFQDERDQSVVLLLDCGRRMRADEHQDKPGTAHFDQVLNAAMLLTYVALRQGDAVGAMTFGTPEGEERWFAPRKGAATLNALMSELFDVQPTPTHSDYLSAAQTLLRRQHKRSLVIVITNFRDEDAGELGRALKLLRSRHLVMTASLRERITQDLIDQPLTSNDSALEVAAAHLYEQARRDALNRIAARDTLIVDAEPERLGIELVNRYHAVKRAGMI